MLNHLIEETISEYGNTVARQLAQASVDDVVRGDLVSLRAQLQNLTQLDTVITAAIYDIEDRPLALAGTTPNTRKHIDSDAVRNFPAPITFDNSIAGKAIVSLNITNLQAIHQRLYLSLTISIIAVALLTIAISYFLARIANRFYRSLSDQLEALSPELVRQAENSSENNWQALNTSLKNLGDYIHQVEDKPSSVSPGKTRTSQPATAPGSYAELVIECINFEQLQNQLHHKAFMKLVESFQHKLDQTRALYHGTNVPTSGPWVVIRFSQDTLSEPPFEAICCGTVLCGLLTEQSELDARLQFRMAVHWHENGNDRTDMPNLLENRLQQNTWDDVRFLCSQANSNEIVATKNIKQFTSVSEHIKLELISGVSEVDCYRVKNISDNYKQLLDKQVQQLNNLGREKIA